GGTINESNIEHSRLGSIGTGKILDALASLRDRDLITQNSDGSFLVTKDATSILWDHSTPLWSRILVLLHTRSCTISEMAEYLLEPQDITSQEAESMREKSQVMITPQRRDGQLLKVYEILEDGKSRMERGDVAEKILQQIEQGIHDDTGKDEMLRLVYTLRKSL
ncbi:MAG: hypothetical protein EB828_01415, partial [Nitrosopumilus sp. D6]